jgi:hypothetical protein
LFRQPSERLSSRKILSRTDVVGDVERSADQGARDFGGEAIASNMGLCSAVPRLKPRPGGRQVCAVGVEVEDDLEQVSDDDEMTRTIPQPLGVTVEDSLADDSCLGRGTETARQVAPEPGRMATQWPNSSRAVLCRLMGSSQDSGRGTRMKSWLGL